jgi:predicted peroxiredoxin
MGVEGQQSVADPTRKASQAEKHAASFSKNRFNTMLSSSPIGIKGEIMIRTKVILMVLAFWSMTMPGCQNRYNSAEMKAGKQPAAKTASEATRTDKLGIVITQSDPETIFNVFRLANYALNQKNEVSIFLLGKGVDLDRIQDAKFNVKDQAETFLKSGGKIMACGTCLKMHNSEGSALCPVSTLNDLYELVKNSDRALTF